MARSCIPQPRVWPLLLVLGAAFTWNDVVHGLPSASIAETCKRLVTKKDLASGLDVVTDPTCTSGSSASGCVAANCRYCRTSDTSTMTNLPLCSSIGAPQPSTTAPAPVTTAPPPTTTAPAPTTTSPAPVTTAPPPTTTAPAPVTTAPAPTTAAPAPTTTGPAPTSTAPTPTTTAPAPTPASTTSICPYKVSAGDAAVGIDLVTDPTCESGGLGCYGDVCRYCWRWITDESAHLLACDVVTSASAESPTSMASPSPTPTPASSPTPSPTGTPGAVAPAFVLDCTRVVSSGDAAVGIGIITDVSCTLGGLGCIDDICRFCQNYPTAQSDAFLVCNDIPLNNGDDVVFVGIPSIVDDAR